MYITKIQQLNEIYYSLHSIVGISSVVVLHIKSDRVFRYRNFYFEKEKQSSFLSSCVSPFHHGNAMVDWGQVVRWRIM